MHHSLLHGDFDLTPEEGLLRDLKHQICEEARTLVERIVLIDAVGGDVTRLGEVLDRIRGISESIYGQPSHGETGGMNRATSWQAALTERSPISGRSNPLAAPLIMEQDGEILRGHATYGRRHEGPFDHLHGGVVVGAFDELLGVAQSVSGQAGYTGTLEVVMRAPTPLFTRIDYEAGVDRIEGRKVFMWGRSFAAGELLCEATGIFVAPREPARTMGHIGGVK